ncbi:3-isopropylmalate dehydratase small subunit [Omnitrophica bacterium]|nr:3-isopropylmalate dehydratase small subunit [Candidatus Omnitrophota bacterium]
MTNKGKAHRLPINDNVNTDYIISGRYKFHLQDPKELAKHIFEDISQDFYSKIERGDFVIAGENFGCGSSREQAPQAIKAAGIAAVIAKSYARIFYRNSFNIGLELIECDTDSISDGDTLSLDLKKSVLLNKAKNIKLYIKPMPPVMRKLLEDGGVIKHFKKHGGFQF